jgi:hypothetical protein
MSRTFEDTIVWYSNPTTMAYNDQLLPYICNNFVVDQQKHSPMDIYVSSDIAWLFPHRTLNISTDQHEVLCNSLDTRILWKTNYFHTPSDKSVQYSDLSDSWETLYTFNIHTPKYSENDTVARYDQTKNSDLIHRYDLKTLSQLGLLYTCGNQETMRIGQVILLGPRDQKHNSYTVCCGYDELLNKLKN